MKLVLFNFLIVDTILYVDFECQINCIEDIHIKYALFPLN